MSLSTTIKSIQDVMRKDAGVDGDAQRIGQLGWMLFFKIYSDLEEQTELEDDAYHSPVPANLRWSAWADEDRLGAAAPTGDDLLELIDNELFPALRDMDVAQFDGKARQRADLLRSVFEDAYNYMKSGTLARQVINKINGDIDFNESTTRHTFGDIYEQVLKDLQGAGNAGEFYTPRAATQFAVDMVAPRFGETVLDPACGTGGFLTAAYESMRPEATTPAKLAELKARICGVEKKALPHLLCVTNLMVHGIEVPSGIRHDNTLARPLRDYGPADQVDVIVTNPPFGGMEEDGIENNFPTDIRTRETADLFLVLVMELLKDGGRAAIVLPDGTLFGEGIKTRIKRQLLEECNLHTVVRLPKGVFAPYTTIKTNILFFTKGEPTKDVWFYEHPYPHGYKSYSKTKPMRIEEFAPEKAWWTDRKGTDRAWKVSVEDIASSGYNLDIPNPNIIDESREDASVLVSRYLEINSEMSESLHALKVSLSPAVEPLLKDSRELLDNLPIVTDAQAGVGLIRQLVLRLATRGALVAQDPNDKPVDELLSGIKQRQLVSTSTRIGPILEDDKPWSLPTGWRWVRFKEVVDFSPGRTPATKDSTFWGGDPGIPWVSIGDMPNGGVVLRTARTVTTKARDDVFRHEPEPVGTMLMSFKLTIGKMAILGVPAFHNEAIISISAPYNEIAQYLFRVMPLLASGGRSKAAIKGDTLNKESLTNLLVPLPPLAEQTHIVAAIDNLMALCNRIDAAKFRRISMNDAVSRRLTRLDAD